MSDYVPWPSEREANDEARKCAAEIARLRALVEEAYRAGLEDAHPYWQNGCVGMDELWQGSGVKRKLEG